MWPWRKPKTFGQQGEALAVRALRRAGYRILARNAELGRYEIDIIAREGDTTVFIEVKTRRHEDAVEPERRIDQTKRDHICRAAQPHIAALAVMQIDNRYGRFGRDALNRAFHVFIKHDIPHDHDAAAGEGS